MPSNEPMTESGLPTSVNRSRLSNPKPRKPTLEGSSPIAADGGFGPMSEDDSEEEEKKKKEDDSTMDNDEASDDIGAEAVGEDFDDFEAGAEEDDFGDFDEWFEQPQGSREGLHETEPSAAPVQPQPPPVAPYVSMNRMHNELTLPMPHFAPYPPS